MVGVFEIQAINTTSVFFVLGWVWICVWVWVWVWVLTNELLEKYNILTYKKTL